MVVGGGDSKSSTVVFIVWIIWRWVVKGKDRRRTTEEEGGGQVDEVVGLFVFAFAFTFEGIMGEKAWEGL